ncbi:MAG: dihydrodipicolinate synthase family protein [Rhodoferax sp.]
MTDSSSAAITGVFPVLPTPFDAAGAPDMASLSTLVRYLLRCGVDGMTFPGVASEVATLSEAERTELTAQVIREVAGRVPVVAGVSSNDVGVTLRLARQAAGQGAAALMVAAPGALKTATEQIDHFKAIAAEVPGTALMLQNVPPPAGAGLDPAVLLEILAAVPTIRYIKEEALPSGQRLSEVLARAPASLLGVLGGAGGRYITDELRRGAGKDAGGLRVALDDGTALAAGATETPAAGTPLVFGIRPEHLQVVPVADGQLRAEVLVAERLGGETYFHARVADRPVIARMTGDSGVSVGETVGLAFDPAQAHCFVPDGRRLQ